MVGIFSDKVELVGGVDFKYSSGDGMGVEGRGWEGRGVGWDELGWEGGGRGSDWVGWDGWDGRGEEGMSGERGGECVGVLSWRRGEWSVLGVVEYTRGIEAEEKRVPRSISTLWDFDQKAWRLRSPKNKDNTKVSSCESAKESNAHHTSDEACENS